MHHDPRALCASRLEIGKGAGDGVGAVVGVGQGRVEVYDWGVCGCEGCEEGGGEDLGGEGELVLSSFFCLKGGEEERERGRRRREEGG